MNLWFIFPSFLLEIKGILSLPLLILPTYLICIIYYFVFIPKKARANSQITRKKEMLPLILFLLLSLLTSVLILLILGPRMGLALPPLLLLSNILFPLVLLLVGLITSGIRSVILWSIASLAGAIHAISWAVWIMALARS